MFYYFLIEIQEFDAIFLEVLFSKNGRYFDNLIMAKLLHFGLFF